MCGSENFAAEDSKSEEVASQWHSLSDGIYGEKGRGYGHFNILGEDKEGTRFLRAYDATSGQLTLFRIYHQGHRDSLEVATVDVTALSNRINELVQEMEKGRVTIDCTLPFSADEFCYEKLVRFNELSGQHVRLNVLALQKRDRFDDSEPCFVLEFSERHDTIGQQFMDLQEHHGILLWRSGDNSHTTLRQTGNSYPLDFYDQSYITDAYFPQNLRLDRTRDDILTYLTIGDRVPQFFPPLLKSYIKRKMKEI